MSILKRIYKFGILSFLILAGGFLLNSSKLVFPISDTATLRFFAKQGESSWEIVPLASSESVRDFYSYNNDQSNTGLEISDQSILFLYRDTNTEAIYLVIIHDRPADGSGGSVDFLFSGLPELSELVVINDPDNNDLYTFLPPEAEIHWEWTSKYNDGLVIGELGEDFEIIITPDFVGGINNWNILSGNIANPDLISLPSITEPIEIVAKVTTRSTPPQACFQIKKKELKVNEPLNFDSSCSVDPDGGIVIYNWDFGDGTTSTTQNPTHKYTQEGVYTVQLTVVDNNQASGYIKKKLPISPHLETKDGKGTLLIIFTTLGGIAAIIYILETICKIPIVIGPIRRIIRRILFL